MNINNKHNFSFYTCGALVWREYYELRSKIIWLGLTIFIILFLTATFVQGDYQANGVNNHVASVAQLYLLVGIIIAGTSFWELRNSSIRKEYLLIPASTFEKVVAKIVVYILGWLMFISILWVIANIFAGIVGTFINHISLTAIHYSCFNGLLTVLAALGSVGFIQMIIIFASCYLRKNILFKAIVIYVLIVLPLTGLIKNEIIELMPMLNQGTSLFIMNIWPGKTNANFLILVYTPCLQMIIEC